MEPIISVFSLGLLLLSLAWAVQSYYITKGKKEINRYFMIVYAIGLLLIVLDGLMQGLISAPMLNVLALLFIISILFKVAEKKVAVKSKRKK